MPLPEPLPFRIRIPGEDSIDTSGVRSVSYRVEGLLHLTDDTLEFEWTATETTEQVSLTKIGTEVSQSPIGRLELPLDILAEVRLRGGWMLPRLLLRARRLGAFERMPRAKGTTVTLRIRRRFRKQAQEMVAAIELAQANATLSRARSKTVLEGSETHHLPDRGNI